MNQHCCRLKLLCRDYAEIEQSIHFMMEHIKVTDKSIMLYMRVDTNR